MSIYRTIGTLVFKYHFETALPIKAKFLVEPLWEVRMKIYINGPGHMTKVAAMPIYGKNIKKSSSLEPEVLKLGKQQQGLEVYNVYMNDGPGLTMTYSMARSNLATYAFEWEKLL